MAACRRSWASSLVLFFVAVLAPSLALGQGLLVNVNPSERVRLPRPIILPPPDRPVPEPQVGYRIKELAVQVKLTGQVAKVQVTQSFVNTGSRQMEVSFLFPLPHDGAIDQLTLLVDGKEMPAKLLPRAEARELYERIVRKNQDPALLEWMGAGLFQTSVFPVPPGAERKVILGYSQVCKKDRGLTDFLFPLSTAKYTSQPVEKVSFDVSIDSQVDIKNVYSPTHAVSVQRDARHAKVSFSTQNYIPSSDFRLLYDVDAGQVGASVLSYRPKGEEDGYFLLLASPQIKPAAAERPKKTVLFVLDSSGSMSGQKIDQAKGALRFVLNNLREGDTFNIVVYSSGVESFRSELQKFDEKTRLEALGFVDGIYAGGSTNLNGAIGTALSQLKDATRPNYVLLLSDGLPTAGETNEMKIVANAKQANQVRARIVSFGVGYDLNARLLERLVRNNFGQSEYVRPDENIEDSVSRVYRRIESPVLSQLQVQFALDEAAPGDGGPVNRVYPKDAFDLFEGDQLVLVGRYKRSGRAKVTISGEVAGQTQRFDFPADLVPASHDESYAFVERLWAARRIGEIIEEIDLNGHNKELVDELVALSVRHGILTPYTSFLADETQSLYSLGENARRAGDNLQLGLRELGGAKGVAQRRMRAGLQGAGGGGAGMNGGPPSSGGAGMSGRGGGRNVPGLQAGAGTPRREAKSAAKSAAGRPELEAAEFDGDPGQDAGTVKYIGAKTFFLRDSQWVDSAATAEQVKKAEKVEQFSDRYFELVDKYGSKLCQYATFDEPVVIEVEGETFSIEPPANKDEPPAKDDE